MKRINSKIALFSGITAPILGSLGLKAAWATGAISGSHAVNSLASTILNVVGAGSASAIKNAIAFFVGKGVAAYDGNWWELAWTIIDAVTAFIPAAAVPRLIMNAGKLVTTL